MVGQGSRICKVSRGARGNRFALTLPGVFLDHRDLRSIGADISPAHTHRTTSESFMKVGFLQFAPHLGDAAATREHVERLLDEVPAVDLLVLPELANSGYNFSSTAQARELSEEVDASPFVDVVRDHCAKHARHVVTGFCEREGDELFNAALLIGPKGIEGKYRKLHLFLNEKDHFRPGNLGLPVFDVGDFRVGMLICFDWIFPEPWRVLALRGADIICHPSNLVLPGLAQQAAPVHALMNRVYIVTANRIGTEGDLTFTGRSTIASPQCQVMATAPDDDEDVQVVEIDLSLAREKAVTARNDVFADRRPEEYRILTDPNL